MWVDNASKIDMLFYKPYAEVIMSILSNDRLTPVTIGLFGSWGAGKSTLLNFVDQKVTEKRDPAIHCININAWLLEGYDDAKAAIIEAVLKEIESCVKTNKTLFDRVKNKIKSILKKVNWLKMGGFLVKKAIATGVSLATANPLPIALSIASDFKEAATTVKGIEEIQEEFIDKQTEKSAAKTIREIRDEFQELLKDAEIKNLIVCIDDLDRCLPDRIVETLEAVKLFLSVERTSFIFAVDENIVRYAIERQYPTIGESAVNISKDYIEKIIQIPIALPELSSKDIQNYLLLLIVENYLSDEAMCNFMNVVESENMLTQKYPIAVSEIDTIFEEVSLEAENTRAFKIELNIIDGIRKVVCSSLKGNPRQAKRFLNTFTIKKELSRFYFGDEIDFKVLAKLLALYIIDVAKFVEVANWFNQTYDGEIRDLKVLVEKAQQNNLSDEDGSWKSNEKLKEWLLTEPVNIYTQNLRNYFYLTRDLSKGIKEDVNFLNDSEMKLMSEINITAPVALKKCFNTISNDKGIRSDVIKKLVIDKFRTGVYELGKISEFFKVFQDMRDDIVAILLNRVKTISLKEVPLYKAMYFADKQKMQVVIDNIEDLALKSEILKP